jgi:FlaG/FlaF family flagellin (archaellin)
MQKSSRSQNTGIKDSGVSEVIGVILLISVVVAAVAIIGVFLFSQSTPQEIPAINFMTGSDNSNRLYLFHNGGDSLTKGTFSVLVDGIVRNDYTISDGSNVWSLGTNLILSGVTSGSHSVAIIYNNTGSGGVLLRSGTSNVLVSATPIINPDVITGSTYPPIISVPQLMQNVTNNTINYYRENGTIIQGGYIQFNITASGINSTIVTGNGLVQLNSGDTVRITPDSVSQGMVVFGMGDQIWELISERALLTITNRTSNPSPYTGAINHTWITSYKDLQSTLTLSTSTPPGSYYTELALNNYPSYAKSQTFSSQVINRTSSNSIQISNVTPNSIGLFVLQFNNKTKSTYFVGSASGYTVT